MSMLNSKSAGDSCWVERYPKTWKKLQKYFKNWRIPGYQMLIWLGWASCTIKEAVEWLRITRKPYTIS
ncbi:unnamed protein product [Nesidiocoris tenuis]|uniref:Uncharacterized protein n=1 Tax=Nesidiocoris tenuis TaxID=355587 RepID=A0A6H5HM65_9HEMI|nr:unnamed protein product [Nesidiocoris tenuis]CAB0017972.1 unnamed protein product [Nesidiocoris tenuis]